MPLHGRCAKQSLPRRRAEPPSASAWFENAHQMPRIDGGSEADSYLLRVEQARGLRRVRSGDWRNRFRKPRPEAGAFVRWARDRHRRR